MPDFILIGEKITLITFENENEIIKEISSIDMDPSVLWSPSQWCAPVVVQAVLSVMVLGIILFYAKLELKKGLTRPLAAFIYLCMSVVMIYVMLYLCHMKMEWASWGLLLLPLFYNILIS